MNWEDLGYSSLEEYCIDKEKKLHPERFDENGNRKPDTRFDKNGRATKEYIKFMQQGQTWDKPYTLEDDEATILYIIVMVVGSIFNSNVAIWIAATVVYFRFLSRHKRRSK